MLTMAEPTTNTVTEPTVTYDIANSQINADVIVSHSPGQQGISISPPVIGVPGSGSPDPVTWTVVWNLVAGSGLSSAYFDTDGLTLPSTKPPLPNNVRLPSSQAVGSGQTSQWTAVIENWVTDVNSFTYTIYAAATIDTPGGKVLYRGSKDPTIVVTMDPIG